MRFPLPPTRIPALDALLNGDLWSQWAGEGKVFPVEDLRRHIHYVRLKPDLSCRLTVLDGGPGTGDEPPAGFLLHLFSDARLARVEYERALARNRGAVAGRFGIFVVESPPAVGIPFPNDPDLPGLRHVWEPARFRRSLTELLPEYPGDEWRIQKRLSQTTILAYKPDRRVVLRIKVKLRRRTGDQKARVLLHAKVASAAATELAHGNLCTIAENVPDGAGWRVPRTRGMVADRTLSATEWIEGEDLFRVLARGGTDALEAMRLAGGALAGLHGLDLSLSHRPSPVEEGDGLRGVAEDIALLAPERRESILRLGEDLSRAVTRFALVPSVIVHGDFHPGQVLLSAGIPVLTDLDAAGRGYAAIDLGSFVARLEEENAPAAMSDAFLDGYRERAVGLPEAVYLRVATAAALFRRAVFPLRTLDPQWPREMERLLDAAAASVDGALH